MLIWMTQDTACQDSSMTSLYMIMNATHMGLLVCVDTPTVQRADTDQFVPCRCVTFESPGMIKYWRNKAENRREASYWREHITEYVTFPNAISTVLPHIGQVVRIELTMQSKCAPDSRQDAP